MNYVVGEKAERSKKRDFAANAIKQTVFVLVKMSFSCPGHKYKTAFISFAISITKINVA